MVSASLTGEHYEQMREKNFSKLFYLNSLVIPTSFRSIVSSIYPAFAELHVGYKKLHVGTKCFSMINPSLSRDGNKAYHEDQKKKTV